ncbi:HEAT repeat domain-containing protein [bacterium]|nr:HEAT repeat domain-containing protein [bacterium]MCI0606974.1 HEAT repeat domain-containing protein [bacterium]
MTEEPSSAPVENEIEAQKEKKILIIFRFVFVPLLVVGIVIFIIVLFGNLALKEKSVKDYLYDIRSGSKSERWQAAYHLSNLLANPKKDYEEQARKNLPEILLIYDQVKGTDPEIRRYLALTLGRLRDPRAVPALIDSANDNDSQTVIWSLWALGSIGDREATPVLLEKLENTDPGIRIMSAYALGVLNDTKAVPALQGHLDDSSAEVSWNAAIALARLGDPSGASLLSKMMDRAYLASFPKMSEPSKKELMTNAIKAAAKLHHPQLTEQIKAISTTDPDPGVRNEAIQALR